MYVVAQLIQVQHSASRMLCPHLRFNAYLELVDLQSQIAADHTAAKPLQDLGGSLLGLPFNASTMRCYGRNKVIYLSRCLNPGSGSRICG